MAVAACYKLEKERCLFFALSSVSLRFLARDGLFRLRSIAPPPAGEKIVFGKIESVAKNLSVM